MSSEHGVLLQKLFRMPIYDLNTYFEGGILLEWQLTHSMEQNPFSDSTSCSAIQDFSNIMSIWNPKILPCSRESANGPFPEPDEYSPYHPIPSL
jgi:hypothetical protein